MGLDDKFSTAKLTTSAAITVSFWIVAVVLWRAMGLDATFGLDAGNRELLKVRADESPNRS